MQDFYRCERGYEEMAEDQINKACTKLVSDMEYEARIQAVIEYYALHKPAPRYKVDKTEARTMKLTVEQYQQVNVTTLIISYFHQILIISYDIKLIMLCRRFLRGWPTIRGAGTTLQIFGAQMSGGRSTWLVEGDV